ncbi:GNAT family N-acetyltransferase [Tumebacillus sp. ITR2]|uniref:GNAT family N-acetyltransferase n=1 Tax=Tumebacillus amylolyticus TaxID=2801339 RepID=A0ABS1JFA4_9BACL|nr:GNAT family N-acetyltransferase [Tumebacillus amylolyticus]MBL0388975.1 GNAT family N-acetyltransferase [Tumebacillus amylolyticus]
MTLLVAKQTLSQQELTEIRELVELCNEFEGIQLKMNWDNLETRKGNQTDDFLYYEDGRLIGYFALFAFQSTEAEMIAAVHPDARRKGIFRHLLDAALQQMRQRNIPKLLFVVDSKSASATAVAKHLGATYAHSEYRMELETVQAQPKRHPNLSVRRGAVEDANFISDVTADAFGYPKRPPHDAEYFAHPTRRIYIFEADGERVGTLFTILFSNDSRSAIYGFCIQKSAQGKGYGRQVLSEVVQELLADGFQSVELEVACENKRALGLYQSVGFEEIGAIDYYALPVL